MTETLGGLKRAGTVLGVVMAPVLAVILSYPPTINAQTQNRIFELRTYTAHPGKTEAMHRRFREHTNRLFVKHGMSLLAYWVPADGPEAENTLIYVLAYPSREAREKSWEGFLNDPEWKNAYEESHRDGPIVANIDSRFLKSVDYSPIQ